MRNLDFPFQSFSDHQTDGISSKCVFSGVILVFLGDKFEISHGAFERTICLGDVWDRIPKCPSQLFQKTRSHISVLVLNSQETSDFMSRENHHSNSL